MDRLDLSDVDTQFDDIGSATVHGQQAPSLQGRTHTGKPGPFRIPIGGDMKNGQVGLGHQGGSQGMSERGFACWAEIGWMKDVPKNRDVERVGKRHRRSPFERIAYHDRCSDLHWGRPWVSYRGRLRRPSCRLVGLWIEEGRSCTDGQFDQWLLGGDGQE